MSTNLNQTEITDFPLKAQRYLNELIQRDFPDSLFVEEEKILADADFIKLSQTLAGFPIDTIISVLVAIHSNKENETSDLCTIFLIELLKNQIPKNDYLSIFKEPELKYSKL